jgi:hypothetical protein
VAGQHHDTEENPMERRKVSLAIALVVGLLALSSLVGSAQAQMPDPSTGMALQAMGANDLQVNSVATTGWWSVWASRFGSISVNGWGRTPVRQGVGRASVAVLRERRSLLR